MLLTQHARADCTRDKGSLARTNNQQVGAGEYSKIVTVGSDNHQHSLATVECARKNMRSLQSADNVKWLCYLASTDYDLARRTAVERVMERCYELFPLLFEQCLLAVSASHARRRTV